MANVSGVIEEHVFERQETAYNLRDSETDNFYSSIAAHRLLLKNSCFNKDLKNNK